MNSDEMSWLLQTIGEQENAKRFVQAQYERRRISHQMIVDLAREHGWTDDAAVQVWTPPHALMEYAAAQQAILAVAGSIS